METAQQQPTTAEARDLNILEAAAWMGIGVGTFSKLLEANRIPKPRTKSPLRWRESDLTAWMHANCPADFRPRRERRGNRTP
ncbi:MAG: hypothetical protein SH850_17040 [Planctomycetaceae bacterium]|nr:hypothetical protein [Planctomycetaceae bacterium]